MHRVPANCMFALLARWYIFLICPEMVEMNTAKVFWSGRSQAVRLPKAFRFDTDEVRIRRHGQSVILEPVAHGWDWLERLAGPVDEDFAAAVEETPGEQERPALDFLD